jgi:hypothetical protein
MGEMAEALNAIAKANNARPDGRPLLDVPPVLVGGRTSVPEEIISEEEVTGWVTLKGQLVEDRYVVPDPSDPLVGRTSSGSAVHRMRVRQTTHLPRDTASGFGAIWERMVLPGLMGEAYWKVRSVHREAVPALVAQSLSTERSVVVPIPKRNPQVRSEIIGPVEPEPAPTTRTPEQIETREREEIDALVRRFAIRDEVYSARRREPAHGWREV